MKDTEETEETKESEEYAASVLSLILPTFNESKNLESLFESLSQVLKPGDEVIVVDDDSADRTWEKAEQLSSRFPFVRVIRRVGRRGLSSAVIEGFEAAKGDVLAVMDADHQHDPAVLRALADAAGGGASMAIASRYIEGGATGEWASHRKFLSRAGTWFAQVLLPVPVSDPMSGFFALPKSVFQSVHKKLSPRGFKILLEIASLLPRGSEIAEVPLQFRPRLHGESKLSAKVLVSFGVQLVHLLVRRLERIAWPLFIILCLLLAALFIPRAWALRSLADAEIRTTVQQRLTEFADKNGWLLSDLDLQSVEGDTARVFHKEHRRGEDRSDCFLISLRSGIAVPCI